LKQVRTKVGIENQELGRQLRLAFSLLSHLETIAASYLKLILKRGKFIASLINRWN